MKNWIYIAPILIYSFISSFDGSVIILALPHIANYLKVSTNDIEWIVFGYRIAICSTALLFGKLGDLIGKTRIFKFGIYSFTIAAIFILLSKNLIFLIIFRTVQGLGASAASSTGLAIISETFPKEKRGAALGFGSVFVALGYILGSALGGVLLSVFTWRSIYILIVFIGLISTIMFYILTNKNTNDKNKDKNTVKFSYSVSAVFMLLSISIFFSSLILGQKFTFTHPLILIGAAIGTILIILFFVREMHIKTPMIQLSIFKNFDFSFGLFCAFIVSLVKSSVELILTFYLQDFLGVSSVMAGFILAIFPIVLLFLSPLSGFISDKIGCQKVMLIGLTFEVCGLLLLLIIDLERFGLEIIFCTIFLAIGNAIFETPNSSIVLSSVDNKNLGLASSVNSLSWNLGSVSSIAFSMTLLYTVMGNIVGHKVDGYMPGQDYAFIFSMRVVFVVLTIILLIIVVIMIFRIIYNKNNVKKIHDI